MYKALLASTDGYLGYQAHSSLIFLAKYYTWGDMLKKEEIGFLMWWFLQMVFCLKLSRNLDCWL